LLVAWKLVRTDWIVVCPWKSISFAYMTGTETSFNRIHRPPVSPAWQTPTPSSSGVKSWNDLFHGDSGSFPNGTPTVRPDWYRIFWKIGIPLALIITYHFRRGINKRGRSPRIFQSPTYESKKQNKSWRSTGHNLCNLVSFSFQSRR